jgi:hypothetical protein
MIAILKTSNPPAGKWIAGMIYIRRQITHGRAIAAG